MSERTTRTSVTFPRPFFLEGLGGEQPAGTYEVETVSERIEGISFLAYRVVSASLVLPLPRHGPHSFQLVRIAPSLVQSAIREAEGGEEGRRQTEGEADAAD